MEGFRAQILAAYPYLVWVNEGEEFPTSQGQGAPAPPQKGPGKVKKPKAPEFPGGGRMLGS